MSEKRREQLRIYQQRRRDKQNENAIISVMQKKMFDKQLFTQWFKQKHSLRECKLTVMEAFELMILGCYYCGNIALSIDRLDSDTEHIKGNCVGCCNECNESKGAVDPKTFILQSVFRTTLQYPEGDDIWYVRKTRVYETTYKNNAKTREKLYDLTKEKFDDLINGMCKYCKRTPRPGTFFGIDKIDPNGNYTENNCVTACTSCNWAKWDQLEEDFVDRDKRISDRYFAGCFKDLPDVPKNTSYQRLKTGKSRISGVDHYRTKKVHQYDINGNYIRTFTSVTEAAQSVNIRHSCISRCANGNISSAKGYLWKY